jgi:hypothetical protein
MALCVNCGIELDDGLSICPLCGKSQGNDGEPEQVPDNVPSDIIRLHRKENRKHLWELTGIIAFSGITVCTIVDLIINRGLRWSLITDVAISAVWIIMTLFLFEYKRTFLKVSFLLLTVLAAFFLIDLIDTGTKWFFAIGFPGTIAAFIAAGAIIILYKAAHFKGLNIIATALIILSGFCIITEMILDKYLNGFVNLRWSLIASVSVLPAALIFFFYHYRLKKGNRLDSFFHI